MDGENEMDLDKPMILPVFDENDTAETFKVKLGQMQKEKLEKEAYGGDRPDFEPTVSVSLNVSTKIWTAYANQNRLEEIGDARKMFNKLFIEYLIKNYYDKGVKE